MDLSTQSGKGKTYAQHKRPTHTNPLIPTSTANVAGSQQRTTDSSFNYRHPPPSYDLSASKVPQTYAAPVNSHPVTPSRPGPSSIGRVPVRPIALTPGFSTENNNTASRPVGNHAVPQIPQNDRRGTSINSLQMTTPIASGSKTVHYGAQAQSPLSPTSPSGFMSTSPGSSRYPYHRSSTSGSSDESPVMPAPPVNARLDHPADPEVYPEYRGIHLQVKLKDPASQSPDSTVEVRREKRVVLEMFMSSSNESINVWGWQGIQLPPTGSVKSAQPRLQEGLLYFSVLVYGGSTGTPLSQPCEKCWSRERRALGFHPSIQPYIVDFKADNPVTILSRTQDSRFLKAEVTFHFTCYTSHQREAYELVVELRDKHHLLVAHFPLPYQFTSVPRRKNPEVMPWQHTPVQQNASHQPQDLYPDHSIPAPSAVPPGSEHHSRGHSVPQQVHQYVPHDTNPNSVMLERLAPSQGHVLGGFRILLSGINFPSPPAPIYAKFGALVTGTFWHNPYTLECALPSSPHPGVVRVLLSLHPHPEAPTLGESNCWFTYTSDRECICNFLLAMSTQGGSTSFESSDRFLPQQPPNLSSERCTLVHHMAQSKGHFAQISADKMENLAFRFLASFVDSPRWRHTISFMNKQRQTLAHLAVLFRYTALLEKLVEWGVDLDVQDVNGFTALHCAYLCKDWECVRILRCAGVDEDLADNIGRLPVDIYSLPTCHTRASTPSDNISSPAHISSEGEDDWEDVPSPASSFEVPRMIARDRPAFEAHTSDSHSRDRPLSISLSSPSSQGSNKSWVRAPKGNLQASNPQIDLTPSPPSRSRQVGQASQLDQHAVHDFPVTSLSTGPSHLYESTRYPVTPQHPSPRTPVSDLTSSLSLSETGSSLPRMSNYRGDSSSDLSSAYPPSYCASPMSMPSPILPQTPLQSSWSHLNPQMHRPDSSASHYRNVVHAGSDAKVQPPRSPCRTGIRNGHPPPSYIDEKAQKGTVDERKIFMGSSHLYLPTSPSPPVHMRAEKHNRRSEKDDIRERKITEGHTSWMSAEQEKEQFARQFAERR